jgi:predicted TPR repeat methyltransferase
MELNEDKSLHAVSLFNKYATAYQEKFMSVHLYEDALNVFSKLLPKENAAVLDLACGPGNVAKYLLQQQPKLQLRGIDLAPNMIALAQQNNPAAFFEVMDCRAIGNFTQRFDAIVCAFCLPYLSKEETDVLMNNMNQLLNEGGICYISTMEDAYEQSRYETGSKGDLVFIHYYERQYLVQELEKKNFVVVQTSETSSVMGNGKEVTDIMIICRKKSTGE